MACRIDIKPWLVLGLHPDLENRVLLYGHDYLLARDTPFQLPLSLPLPSATPDKSIAKVAVLCHGARCSLHLRQTPK